MNKLFPSKLISLEGHEFNDLQEVLDAVFDHSGNYYEYNELKEFSEHELIQHLSDCYSVKLFFSIDPKDGLIKNLDKITK